MSDHPFVDSVYGDESARSSASGPRIIWCIGLYASGSTWLFNAGKKIAAASGLDAGLVSFFATNCVELIFPPDTITAIVKTHEVDAAAADTLIASSHAIWLSLRDPRDCITSLMMYQDCNFDEALEMIEDSGRLCQLVLDHPNTKLFRYEDNFFDTPATLDNLASTFGHRLNAGNRARIYNETRRTAIEAFIKTFPDITSVVDQPEPGHSVDLDTQWHTHHAGRDGEIGRWRRVLTSGQIAAVDQRLAELMVRFRYQP